MGKIIYFLLLNANFCDYILRSNTVMKLSCELVQFFISQRSVGLLSRVAHSFSQVLQQLSQSTAEPPERHYGKESLYKTVFFTDDLRTGDFKYVVDESGRKKENGQLLKFSFTCMYGFPPTKQLYHRCQ